MTQKKLATRIFGVVMALLMVVSIVPLTTIKTKAAGSVDDFVTRCYQLAFQRTADPEGFEYWKKEIVEQRRTGVDVVHCFIFSDEYKAQNTSDSQFVKDLYTMFMGREPDQAGYDYWCEKIASGMTREQVFAGFGNSPEFSGICADYGITAGYYTEEIDAGRLNALNLFVGRMYETTLERTPDQEGQIYWVNGLAKGELSGTELAAQFIQSKEFEGRKLSNEEYVEKLYAAFMGRTPDEGGKKNWTTILNDGDMNRDEVFACFANSAEFKGICESYGIVTYEYEANECVALRKIEGYRNGKLATLFLYITEENEHYGVVEEEIQYDENGNETYHMKYSYEHNKEYSTQYDPTGKVIGRNEHLYKDNGMNLWSKFYDENGVLAYTSENVWTNTEPDRLKESIDYEGDKVKERRRETNEYDANGNVISKVIKNCGKMGENYVYTYDSSNRVVEVKHDVYNEEGTKVLEAWNTKVSYAADGSCVEVITLNNQIYTKMYYAAPVDGSSEMFKSEMYEDGKVSQYCMYEYGNNGNKITTKLYSGNNKLIGYEIREFNKKGYTKSAVNYDANGKVTDSETYVFTYK